jgi:hypothetical protein
MASPSVHTAALPRCLTAVRDSDRLDHSTLRGANRVTPSLETKAEDLGGG